MQHHSFYKNLAPLFVILYISLWHLFLLNLSLPSPKLSPSLITSLRFFISSSPTRLFLSPSPLHLAPFSFHTHQLEEGSLVTNWSSSPFSTSEVRPLSSAFICLFLMFRTRNWRSRLKRQFTEGLTPSNQLSTRLLSLSIQLRAKFVDEPCNPYKWLACNFSLRYHPCITH